MIRPLLHGALGHLVHARMDMEELKVAIINDVEMGYMPTYRGHPWTRVQIKDLEAAGHAIELAFSLMKGVQFPEMRESRVSDVDRSLVALRDYWPLQLGNG